MNPECLAKFLEQPEGDFAAMPKSTRESRVAKATVA
jgi:hypothetical protein